MLMPNADTNDPALELNYRAWLPPDRRAPILDLGCGDGRVLRFLSALGYEQVLGVDRDEGALASIGALPGVTLECRDVDPGYLDRHRGRFRLIVLRQMIYYVGRGEVMAFLLAAKDALTDDGVILVEFFNAALLSSRLTEQKDPFIRTAYTEHAMRRLFEAAGLHVRAIHGERRRVSGLRSGLYAALRAIWVQLLKAIYILERGIDNELPRIYTKSIVAVASKQPPGTVTPAA
jgi:SAM-dependent methyltransferase